MRALRIKLTPPSGLRLCPTPPPIPTPHSPLEQLEKGVKEKGGGDERGEREGRERGSENERQGLVCGKDGAGREGGSLTPRSHHH
jgi:hypothetical protein